MFSVGDGAEPGRAVHVRAAIISARFAGMNRHPNTQRDVCRPGLRAERALNLPGGRDRVGRSRKNRKDAVAFAAFQNDHAVTRFDLARHNVIMALERDLRFRGMRLPRPGRSFHIREQEGYGPDWALPHYARL